MCLSSCCSRINSKMAASETVMDHMDKEKVYINFCSFAVINPNCGGDDSKSHLGIEKRR